jgi:site-specific recombinase XerD
MSVVERICQYDSCRLWIEGLRSKATKRAYSVHISLFCKFYDTNPDELVGVNPQELKDMIIKYVLELRKKSKNTAGKPKRGETSVNSIKMYLAGVKSFLDEHEISLPWKKIARYCPDEVPNGYRSYTRQEISNLLSISDLRDRCIILLMASSGIRVGAIPALTIESLKKLDEGLGLLMVYGDSKKSRYVTLVTPECMSTIDQYLEYRKKQGEKLNERSPLIRDKYAIYSKRVNLPQRPKEQAINAQIRQLIRKANLPFEELQPDHAARKFFNTVLVNSKVDGKFKELMMGHSVKLDEFYYDKNSPESRKQILLEYMKAVDALTINEEFRLRREITIYEDRLKEAPRIEQLQEQLASRIIEQDSIKKTVEKLQREKELQDQYIRKNETELKSVYELLDRVLNLAKNDPGIIGRMLIKPESRKLDVKLNIPKQTSHIGMECVTQQEIHPVKKIVV